jgi:uncharacterized membrane protein
LDKEMAGIVFDSLKAMRGSQVFGLDDSVIVTMDSEGQAGVRTEEPMRSGLANKLAGLFIRSPDSLTDVDKVGLDKSYVATVVSALRSHGSALLFFLGSESLSDVGELLKALARFHGTVHQTTLPSCNEARLWGML